MQDDLFGDADAGAPAEPAAQQAPSRRPKRAGVQPATVDASLQAIAAQLPAHLRFGVSTWSYPGWDGLVWDGAYEPSLLSRQGLTAYHQHPLLRTVCIDRTFWRPLTTTQYETYAGQVNEDFRFVVKCPASITDAQVRAEDGKAREANADFLDPQLAIDQFVRPATEGLGDKLGVLVFQLSPLSREWLQRPDALFARLGQLLAAVRDFLPDASPVIVAVELRDASLLGDALIHTLKAHQATFCLGLHSKMPPIEDQLDVLRSLWPGPLVCRWSLNRIFGPYGYEAAQKKHDPFNEIRSEDTHTLGWLARTIRGTTSRGQPAFVTVSNDAEGCAPLTIARLARQLLEP
ncbi:DUF72 domain-containing protein [Achromobacter sp. GG226]|uniref:DUF72 domain-containing protein n=1 Tax=Verticiella alkaliphila TaxID=2779529 RepID=UPI001C0E5E17|nr:DUF72 domain-containing protein [Verticiella sp. GG226]MBU4610471.1 DUF72 domain-containing protein [Verticiella sp. GG226]